MFGDIVKVTPSSKVVGDMALFMTANGYSEKDILEKGDGISFPDSVIGLFKGDLGQTPGGLPKDLSNIILKKERAFSERPNAHLKPIDFDKAFEDFQQKYGNSYTFLDLLSSLFYPKVFDEYHKQKLQFGDLYYVPSTAFFFGLKANEETLIELAPGKSILVKMLYISETDEDGIKHVFFKLNGQTRSIEVKDKGFTTTKKVNKKVTSANEVGAPLQGKLSRILVKEGDVINKNTPLFTIEAMKMESTIVASKDGAVKGVLLTEGVFVEQDDVVLELV
jgi:pyruvate carboxylase